MTGDRWTFLVVRGEDSPVKQYTFSTRTLHALLVGAALANVFRFLRLMHCDSLRQRADGKGGMSGQQKVKRTTEAVDVGS